MKPDTKHIKQIKVVSNTHWDREFRRSFEKTRKGLLDMMDLTVDILENDPEFHSFTMDGHCIMIDDYLEMRPEKTESVKRLIAEGRLVIGPFYTLAEQFSISHEALVRNLLFGKKTIEKYNGKMGTVAYTPSSWGQTGQYPQILSDFGLKRSMFYRGISHHEADAEYIWSAPDGTRIMASRFALYARYNWYYLVHRAVTRGRTMAKDYKWGEYDEVPVRIADEYCEVGQSYDLRRQELNYDPSKLKEAIKNMIETEGRHFTTEVFLAMNGHDISVAHPLESKILRDAKEMLGDEYTIEHTDLEGFWKEADLHIDRKDLPVLTGERRAYLKEGKWTYLLPGTISARTYLKQMDNEAYTKLVYGAEPMSSIAMACGGAYPAEYLNRGWKFLLSNHTHDANGGCAPDAVCSDMEYRYRVASDSADIASEGAMAYVAENLSPGEHGRDAILLTFFNTLPHKRDVVAYVDIEIPAVHGARSVALKTQGSGKKVAVQPVATEKSSVFVDSIWDVPTILESSRLRFHADIRELPAMGYRSYLAVPEKNEIRTNKTMITGPDSMENKYLKVRVNGNGTIDITNKKTGKEYRNLNYLRDQGECGNAWRHADPDEDRIYNSLGTKADVCITRSGELSSIIEASYDMPVPADYGNGRSRSERMAGLKVRAAYRLDKDSDIVKVSMDVENTAKDHWLRAGFPTSIKTCFTSADSHYDIVARQISVPDGTGWVEKPRGTHPLRTFVSVYDKTDGFALFTRGLFEYEAFEDEENTLALTLIRACRIKLEVSSEKLTELPDQGIQCPGHQHFDYAINVFSGGTEGLITKAAEYNVPVRCMASGRGKGSLEPEMSILALDNKSVHVTCVKKAEDNDSMIIRLFNPSIKEAGCTLTFGYDLKEAYLCSMSEEITGEAKAEGNKIRLDIGPKKIVTLKVK